MLIWCNNCLKGVSISRVSVPDNEKFIDINKQGDIELNDIPNFSMIKLGHSVRFNNQ